MGSSNHHVRRRDIAVDETFIQSIEAGEHVEKVAPHPRHGKRRHAVRIVDCNLTCRLRKRYAVDPFHDDRRCPIDTSIAIQPRDSLDAAKCPMLLVFPAERAAAKLLAPLCSVFRLDFFGSRITCARIVCDGQHSLQRQRLTHGVLGEHHAPKAACARALIVDEQGAEPAPIRRLLVICKRNRCFEMVDMHHAKVFHPCAS